MQRFHFLRWLALAVGLLVTQCVDSLSDDCTKTLTCGNEPRPTLDAQCLWRFPDGGIWTEGPSRNSVTGRWQWPDGRETETQDFTCGPPTDGDAGIGDGEPNCTPPAVGCDTPEVCDPMSLRCVECLSNAQCSGSVPVGDAGVATVCDTGRKECVQCLGDSDCTGEAGVCKVDRSNSDRNECVECIRDEQCDATAPVCDESSNECTLRCTNTSECTGSEKPVCNEERELCVECIDATTCATPTPQCNDDTNECVECVEDAPCRATNEVCDTTSSRCVQCINDTQCVGQSGGPRCDTDTNLCVQCLNDAQCTAAEASRCNTVSNVCVGCTASAQCEGALCDTNPASDNAGQCVQCLSTADCMTMELAGQCEPASGTCVECLNSTQCLAADAAHCNDATDILPADTYRCVGCLDNNDCGKPGMGGLCRADGACVNCTNSAECVGDPARSLCTNAGVCAPCGRDLDCAAHEQLDACLIATAAGASNTCVQCVNDTHCADNPGALACKTSNVGPLNGPGAINVCVECVTNADCTSPTASRCSANQCVPCTVNGDCAGIDSTPGAAVGTALNVCDVGACVQCTGTQFQGCANGANVCNSSTKQCTTFAVGSADSNCDVCVSDAHCASNARCAPHTFGTSSGHFCFPVNNPTCLAVPFAVLTTGTIDSTTQTACLLRQTTCAAYLHFTRQPCDVDAECGVAGVNDGICDTDEDLCSLPCTDPRDCSGGNCAGGVCEL